MKQIYIFCLLFVSLFSSAQIINIPDANFKAKLLAANNNIDIASNSTQVNVNFSVSQPNGYCNVDLNNDGEIQVSEASNIQFLNIYNSNISNLSGIEFFSNLKVLHCNSNPIVNHNLINLLNLQKLEVASNQISSLNLNGLSNLKYLNCAGNSLNSLTLTGCISLKELHCYGNQLVNLNTTSLINLQYLDCDDNQLSNLNLNNLTNLSFLRCNNNLISNINLENCTSLTIIGIGSNLLSVLDVSDCHNLQQLGCFANNLISLNIKNGSIINNSVFLNYSLNPNLAYICADENEISIINSQNSDYNLTNCQVNSYCTFVPGGTFHTIQGQQKFDNENDNCDATDNFIPNFKYSITDGTTTGSIISNNSGSYSIPVQAGIHTITPVFENPSYFNVSPTNVVVNFPTQTSPFTQDFCITSNGTHHNVEISIISTNPARPGFDANYKIIYKNKGNQVESGTINLQFNDAILDYVSSSIVPNIQTLNNLSWNYSNLQPFETKIIGVVLNLNSPIETPAVNSGNILNYTVTNTITNTDEILSDNTFVLNQTVVNSYDPNDKKCLQGNTINPAKVGDYVHYVIRFENTGTFPAQNIVVKDMINTSRFDVTSLIPLHASHNYVTRISGNKVEFIFENINLPFDDANNDGYIAFKIKTLPSLVIGNTFSNSANIYFDYNFPIVTNTATTTIAALNNPSFEFANYFSIYPNPTSNELNINLKSAIEINSIQIYNTIGQLVTVQTGNALKVDVSNLKTGNYFIKINTNEGFSTSQFIKE
ncbi:MAG: T9SS type A sorting domain-containing protein [Bacteroidota bacterium]